MSEYIERGALESKAVYMHGFGKNKYVPLKAIQQATAADVVEVKHGRWIQDGYDRADHIPRYTCSNCRTEHYMRSGIMKNYCPNCGAKMDGECREG